MEFLFSICLIILSISLNWISYPKLNKFKRIVSILFTSLILISNLGIIFIENKQNKFSDFNQYLEEAPNLQIDAVLCGEAFATDTVSFLISNYGIRPASIDSGFVAIELIKWDDEPNGYFQIYSFNKGQDLVNDSNYFKVGIIALREIFNYQPYVYLKINYTDKAIYKSQTYEDIFQLRYNFQIRSYTIINITSLEKITVKNYFKVGPKYWPIPLSF